MDVPLRIYDAYESTKSAGLEPAKWLDQNELPYHLATTYYIIPEGFYGRKHQSYLDSPLTPMRSINYFIHEFGNNNISRLYP